MSHTDCLLILKYAPSLSCYEIQNMKLPIDWGIDKIQHDRLQRLIINCQSPFGSAFLRRVTLPSLEILECTGKLLEISIPAMLQRSSSILTRFILETSEVDQEKLISVLWAMHTLQRLEIRATRGNASSPDALLRLMASTAVMAQPGGSTSEFLPNLQHFAYRRPFASTGFAWSLIPDIFAPLSSQVNAQGRPLKTAIFCFGSCELVPGSFLSRKSIPRFLNLQKDVDLSIQFGDETTPADFIRLSANHHNISSR